ncbi:MULTISPECIES: hypothetical protein [Burkholderia]|uniref:hypothetical protein n=1 Tax=Burkholderia TaxID=32008 RepID=UPI000A7698F4|nr:MULTISPECIES: hypothetical protein [Burkholderia]
MKTLRPSVDRSQFGSRARTRQGARRTGLSRRPIGATRDDSRRRAAGPDVRFPNKVTNAFGEVKIINFTIEHNQIDNEKYGNNAPLISRWTHDNFRPAASDEYY